jgi:hypothetical protein
MNSVREIADACHQLISWAEQFYGTCPLLLEKGKVVEKAISEMVATQDSTIDDSYDTRVANSKRDCELEGLQLEQLLSSKHSKVRETYDNRRTVSELYRVLNLITKRWKGTQKDFADVMVDLRFSLDMYNASRNLIFSLDEEQCSKVADMLVKYARCVQ